MNDKYDILATLEEEFNRWETLLNSLSEKQLTTPLTPSHWTPKDVVAHLWAWQQVSIAKLDAALLNKEPLYPDWYPSEHPAAGADTDQVNARIYELYRDQSWSTVYRNWKEGFQRFIALAEAIPEKEIFDKEKYAWLEGYDIAAVLKGSYVHHQQDHYEPLVAWLREHGGVRSSQ
jgi:hypothetical protein